jgi:hypothetical protein
MGGEEGGTEDPSVEGVGETHLVDRRQPRGGRGTVGDVVGGRCGQTHPVRTPVGGADAAAQRESGHDVATPRAYPVEVDTSVTDPGRKPDGTAPPTGGASIVEVVGWEVVDVEGRDVVGT